MASELSREVQFFSIAFVCSIGQESNRSFVVTNRPGAELLPAATYDAYVARGDSEVFGTLSYTTTAGKLAPMFVTEDASAFAFFAEVCYSGDPFATLIRETRKGVVKEVPRGNGGRRTVLRPLSSKDTAIVLY